MRECRIRRDIRNTTILSLLAALIGVTGCSETQLAAHVVKSVTASAGMGGAYKVGKPYQINGTTYVPQVDPNYNETSIASWYGTEFHGKPTANGDTYDMNAMTAAHTTLPMPSQVRVTNLENGRSVILTVNDRGPFVKNRVIDVSRRAGQLLGFSQKGTAEVRVQIVPDGDRAQFQTAALSPENSPVLAPKFPAGGLTQPAGPDPVAGVSMQAAAPPPGAKVSRRSAFIGNPPPAQPTLRPTTITPVAAIVAPSPKLPAMFVQGGAFREQENAEALQREFVQFGPTEISPATVDGKTFYRVRLGPVYNSDHAEKLLTQIVDAGHPRARLVVD